MVTDQAEWGHVKTRKILAFFGQGQPENNVKNTEINEAKLLEKIRKLTKAKVAKQSLQDTWLEK